MMRTMLASAMMAAFAAGSAGAQTILYDDGSYVELGPPVVVERRTAVIPAPGMTFVEPAPRVVVIPELAPLPPGALTAPDANDNKRVARPLPRHWQAPAGGIVVYP